MKKLDDEIRPMIDSIKANIHESRTLAAIRDALLPKLLSGEVRVKDVEKISGGKSMSELQTVFKKVDYNLSGLLHYIDIGDIGLPDIQRPFVWSAAKVRDLFDSMYRGFPVGYLLFWSNAQMNGVRQIGLGNKGHQVPSLLIVDGQQRLTSLYSVFRGKPILDENYQERKIEIAFRPRDGRFEVSDAAIKKDPEFIPDISVLWTSGKAHWGLVNNFLAGLEAKNSHHRGRKGEARPQPGPPLRPGEIPIHGPGDRPHGGRGAGGGHLRTHQ